MKSAHNPLIEMILLIGCLVISTVSLADDKRFTATAVVTPGNGKLYVYWPGQRWGEKSRKTPEIQLDGEPLGLLKYKTYIERELPEGTYNLKLTGSSDASNWDGAEREFPAKIEAGENMFVRLLVKYDQRSNKMLEGRMKYALTFLPRAEEYALAEMGKLKPAPD